MNRMARPIPQPNVTSFGREQLPGLPAGRVIPYEYVADFTLKGEVGNLIQDVINVSVEGVFVAVSIAYAFDEDQAEPLLLQTGEGRAPAAPATLGDVTLDNIPLDALIGGFRINPEFGSAAVTLQSGQAALNKGLPLDLVPLADNPNLKRTNVLQRLKPSENFSFLFSIVDTGTGRELQNKPVHSLATLGGADGRRPFKMLPQPMVFMPRSTIRLQVEERSAATKGKLFITLQGYKVFGLAGGSEEELRKLGEFDSLSKVPIYDHESGNYRTIGEALQQEVPTTRIVPFDYVSTLDLTGRRGNIVEDEVPINVDGGYVATAVGYSLDVRDTDVEIALRDEHFSDPNKTLVDLKKIQLADIKPVQTLLDGFRLHPLRLKFAFGGDGRLSAVDKDLVSMLTADQRVVSRIVQNLNRPEAVRFLYSINDSGTGRDLQNQRVQNVASLGIADGERPFKTFHKSMTFLPRSTIRVQVEEVFGRGRLFLVFQGYKILR